VDVELTDNTGEACGALCLFDADLDLQGGRLSGNRAERSGASPDGEGGGAIFGYDGELDIKDAVFENNHAARDGGAIRAGLYVDLTLERCSFSGNSAGYGGGAVALDGAGLEASDTQFVENTAGSGGALGCGDSLEVTVLRDVRFTDNTARSGGAIACGGQSLTLDGVELQDNTASHTGGGLVSAASTTRIMDSRLVGNTAQDGGGAALYSTAATIQDTVLIGNLATNNGGALAVQSISELTLERATVDDNEAAQGGGVWVEAAARLTGDTLDFTDNRPDDVYSVVSGSLALGTGATVDCDETGCR
jgi:predicted outer membrane repeat protein